jgi:ribosome-associated protein
LLICKNVSFFAIGKIIGVILNLPGCNFVYFISNFGYMADISAEIKFKTARSGGKGGQNVNKVETMAEGYWLPTASNLFTNEQKALITEKLASRINSEGFLLVKSQAERTQLANKQQVTQKMNLLVTKALVIPKKRKPTRIPKAVIEKRLENKKKGGEKKAYRKKIKLV